MKRILAIALVLVSTLVVAGSSSAQNYRVKATVPFTFMLGDFTVPPGNYMIDSTASSPVLVLRNLAKGIKIVAMGGPNQGNPQGVSALVFHRYGNQYFLSQIRSQGVPMNIDFPATEAEEKARARYLVAGRSVDAPVLIALSQ